MFVDPAADDLLGSVVVELLPHAAEAREPIKARKQILLWRFLFIYQSLPGDASAHGGVHEEGLRDHRIKLCHHLTEGKRHPELCVDVEEVPLVRTLGPVTDALTRQYRPESV